MLQYPDINPIAIEIGSFAIRWYGLMYLIGFMGAFYYCLKNRKHAYQPWSVDAVADLLFYTALGVIFGGTIGYWLLYEPSEVMANPFNLFKFWQPGRSFHGGLIGVIIAVVIFCQLYRKHFLEVMDFIAPAVPIGLAFGRIGNFINAELWGRVTDAPWGMIFPHAGIIPRHPSQLYEFLLEGVLLFIILFWFTRKKRPLGATSALFAIGYGAFRFLVEFFREPDETKGISFDWLTMGQVLSIPLILVGILLLFYAYSKNNKGTENIKHQTSSF